MGTLRETRTVSPSPLGGLTSRPRLLTTLAPGSSRRTTPRPILRSDLYSRLEPRVQMSIVTENKYCHGQLVMPRLPPCSLIDCLLWSRGGELSKLLLYLMYYWEFQVLRFNKIKF